MYSLLLRHLPRCLKELKVSRVQLYLVPCAHRLQFAKNINSSAISKQAQKSQDHDLDVKRENPYEHLTLGQRGEILVHRYFFLYSF